MAVRSKKPKAVALIKWLNKKGVEKIQEEHHQAITDRDNQIQALEHTSEKHQQLIEEKDTTIALLNDDLKIVNMIMWLCRHKGMYIRNSYKNGKTSLPILKNVMFIMQKTQAKTTLL